MTRKPTYDAEGSENGWLGLIWRRDEAPELAPDQVYVTAVAPGCVKGPHAHHSRSAFVVLLGDVRIVTGLKDGWSGESKDWSVVPPGTPAAIYNVGTTEALVLNLKSPAWTPDDDIPVTDWQHPEWWKPKVNELRYEIDALGHAVVSGESFGVALL